MGEPAGQYFEAEPTAPSRRSTARLDLPDRSLTLTTDRGVFSADRIDPGTKYLLLEAPAAPVAGTFVDLGCGYGPIACTLAARSPEATVWAVDVNTRARALCAENATRNGIANVRVAAPDKVPSDHRFGAIWSNPPIRIGKLAVHDLLLRWLPRLTPEGAACLVVQKHLGADSLQQWLTNSGYAAERIAVGAGFRILRVTPLGFHVSA